MDTTTKPAANALKNPSEMPFAAFAKTKQLTGAGNRFPAIGAGLFELRNGNHTAFHANVASVVDAVNALSDTSVTVTDNRPEGKVFNIDIAATGVMSERFGSRLIVYDLTALLETPGRPVYTGRKADVGAAQSSSESLRYAMSSAFLPDARVAGFLTEADIGSICFGNLHGADRPKGDEWVKFEAVGTDSRNGYDLVKTADGHAYVVVSYAEHAKERGMSGLKEHVRVNPEYYKERLQSTWSQTDAVDMAEKLQAIDLLRGYPEKAKVFELYDGDDEFSSALNTVFGQTFEYPDFSHRTVGAVLKLANAKLTQDQQFHSSSPVGIGVCSDAIEADQTNLRVQHHPDGKRGELDDPATLELHGIVSTQEGAVKKRDEKVGLQLHPDSSTTKEQNGQIPTLKEELAQYGEVRDGGCVLKTDGFSYLMYVSRNVVLQYSLDCQNTSDERLQAHWSQFVAVERLGYVNHAVPASTGENIGTHLDAGQNHQAIAHSHLEAQNIGLQSKGSYRDIDVNTNQTLAGVVIGVTQSHIALSLGRSAAIVAKSDVSRVPVKDESVMIVFHGGKGVVSDVAHEKTQGLSR